MQMGGNFKGCYVVMLYLRQLWSTATTQRAQPDRGRQATVDVSRVRAKGIRVSFMETPYANVVPGFPSFFQPSSPEDTICNHQRQGHLCQRWTHEWEIPLIWEQICDWFVWENNHGIFFSTCGWRWCKAMASIQTTPTATTDICGLWKIKLSSSFMKFISCHRRHHLI